MQHHAALLGDPQNMTDYFKNKYGDRYVIQHQDVPLMQLEGRRPGETVSSRR